MSQRLPRRWSFARLPCLLGAALALVAPVAWGDGFAEVVEIPLPGPLTGQGPRWAGEQVEVPLVSGIARTGWQPGATPEILKAAEGNPLPLSERWVLSPDGRYRARIDSRGRIETQRACRRCKRGWKRDWRARLPAASIVPPAIDNRFVYVGTLDNRAYALKRRNGHRVWFADLGRRVMRPLVVSGSNEEGSEPLLLVLPGAGDRLLALATADGAERASYELSDGGSLVGGALPTPDGHILVAKQGYRRERAGLLVLALGGEQPDESMPYNEPSEQRGEPQTTDR